MYHQNCFKDYFCLIKFQIKRSLCAPKRFKALAYTLGPHTRLSLQEQAVYAQIKFSLLLVFFYFDISTKSFPVFIADIIKISR